MLDFKLDLYLVTDENLAKGGALDEIVEESIKGGTSLVQLREKNVSTRTFLSRAIEIKKITDKYDVPLIINDRLDIALAVDAAGLHIGQSDMPYEIARKILGYNKIIGLSVETLQDAKEAENFDVDYLAVSPVFFTRTKTDIKQPLGLDGLRYIAGYTKHRLVGIGGINANNCGEVVNAGAEGLAVISAIIGADLPYEASLEIKNNIMNARKK